tara:strand:+ start:784 stop:2676 length:1893 start_codon:yes stop_codon:yes gene_type:complete
MSYRNPTKLQYVNFKKPSTGTGKGLEAQYATYNQKLRETADANKKANRTIKIKNDLANASAQADFASEIQDDSSYIDQNSLNLIAGNSFDKYYESKTRLEQSTENYENFDDDGNLLYSYESDLQIVKDLGKFTETLTQQQAALQYASENFTSLGTGDGKVLTDNLDPMFELLRNIGNPGYDGYNAKYIMESSKGKAPQLGIRLTGNRVREINETRGEKGDQFTILPGELQALLNNADGDPNDLGYYRKNGSYVTDISKELETGGVVKAGEIQSAYKTEGQRISKVLPNGSTQYYDVSVLNHEKLNQTIDPKAKAQVASAANYGESSLSTMIRQYADEDADGNYYVEPLAWDNNKNKYVKSGQRIEFGDGWDNDYDPANDAYTKTYGFNPQTLKNVQELVKTRSLEKIGANMDPIRTKAGQPVKPSTPSSTGSKSTAGERAIANQRSVVDKALAQVYGVTIEEDGSFTLSGENPLIEEAKSLYQNQFDKAPSLEKAREKQDKFKTKQGIYRELIEPIISNLNGVGGDVWSLNDQNQLVITSPTTWKKEYEYEEENGEQVKVIGNDGLPKFKLIEVPTKERTFKTPVDINKPETFEKVLQEAYNFIGSGLAQDVGEARTPEELIQKYRIKNN